MTRRVVVLLLAGTLGLLFGGANSCGSTPTAKTPTQDTSPTPTQDTSSTPTPAPTGKVGDSVVLQGQSGEKAKVRLLSYLGQITGDPQVDQPSAGHIFVGVRIQITNVGNALIDEVPGNDGKVILTSGEQGENTTVSSGECSSATFDVGVKVTPGSSVQGCIPFQIPANGHVKKFQFTLSSGFADQTAEWNVR